MRLIKILYFLLPFLGASQAQSNEAISGNKLFVCYGKINPELVKGYALVVLESEHYSSSEIAIFNKNNKKVVAYLSLSEVNVNASFYKEIEPLTFGENEIWNSCFIDIKNKKAQEILEKVITKIKEKGVQGLFLDNLDNVSKWGKLHNQKEDFIQFLSTIKRKNKGFYLVQNAGLFMAKELNSVTDAIVVESIVSSYNFKTKEYELRDKASKKQIIKNVKETKKQVKKSIYVIEYAESCKMRETILAELKKLGLSSFLGQIELQSIPKFK